MTAAPRFSVSRNARALALLVLITASGAACATTNGLGTLGGFFGWMWALFGG